MFHLWSHYWIIDSDLQLSLYVHYAAYEIHFTCRTRDEIFKTRALMTLIPASGSRMADVGTDTSLGAYRVGDGVSLGQLFNTLASHNNTFTQWKRRLWKACFLKSFERIMFEKKIVTVVGGSCFVKLCMVMIFGTVSTKLGEVFNLWYDYKPFFTENLDSHCLASEVFELTGKEATFYSFIQVYSK